MTSLLGVFLALVGPFLLQNVQGLLHVVTTSTTGLETAGLAEESWHDKRGLTVALLVGFVMGSLSVLDQELGDYELRVPLGWLRACDGGFLVLLAMSFMWRGQIMG